MSFEPKKSVVNMSAEEYLNIIVDLSEEIFHDFKNTLATISGLSQLATIYSIPKEARENLEQIQEATFECRNQIDRFYGIIKGYNVETNQYEMVSNILFSTLDMVKHRIRKKENGEDDIGLKVNIHSMRRVYCNEHKMRQAILNIIMNAIDAMEETGGILKVNLYDKEELVILEIVDTGVGIPEDKLGKIFQVNYTTKGPKGTGLGLRISKSIIEEIDGKIEVTSKVGKGTKFTVCLLAEDSLKSSYLSS